MIRKVILFLSKKKKTRKPTEKGAIKHPDYLNPINLIEVTYAQTGQSKAIN